MKIHAPGLKEHLDALTGRDDPVSKAFDERVRAYLEPFSHAFATKADIIRAHPDLHPREIRKRYGISVNHVRVQRAQDKAKNSGKLK